MLVQACSLFSSKVIETKNTKLRWQEDIGKNVYKDNRVV